MDRTDSLMHYAELDTLLAQLHSQCSQLAVSLRELSDNSDDPPVLSQFAPAGHILPDSAASFTVKEADTLVRNHLTLQAIVSQYSLYMAFARSPALIQPLSAS